jgi:acetyl esterase/lipase
MKITIVSSILLLVLIVAGMPAAFAAGKDQGEQVLLWPGGAPGEKGDRGEEHDNTKHNPNAKPGTEIILLTSISKPMITIYKPAPEKANGAAVIVCPGGGYSILAYDLEGTEVCEWLNKIGVTAVLLKYRVPGRLTDQYRAPLQDSQRALSMVRSRAKDWGIDPKRVGILGFSAGGHLSAVTSNSSASRSYAPVDVADQESCRPDFTILIYPAYLTTNDDLTKLEPQIKVTSASPPAIIIQTQDDAVKVENAYIYALALTNAKVPVELHVYPKGGHGYGLRPSANPVSHWPDRVGEWLQAQGWLKKG